MSIRVKAKTNNQNALHLMFTDFLVTGVENKAVYFANVVVICIHAFLCEDCLLIPFECTFNSLNVFFFLALY